MLLFVQLVDSIPCKESGHAVRSAIQHYVDVVVARKPWILEQLASFLFKTRGKSISQPVQCFAQKTPPGLIPSDVSGVATTIGAPTLDSMYTTPKAVLEDLDFVN